MMGTQYMTAVGKKWHKHVTLSKLLSLSVPQFSFLWKWACGENLDQAAYTVLPASSELAGGDSYLSMDCPVCLRGNSVAQLCRGAGFQPDPQSWYGQAGRGAAEAGKPRPAQEQTPDHESLSPKQVCQDQPGH